MQNDVKYNFIGHNSYIFLDNKRDYMWSDMSVRKVRGTGSGTRSITRAVGHQ